MNTDELIELDKIAIEAHQVWTNIEYFKIRIAEKSGWTKERLEQEGIHVPDNMAKIFYR